MSQLAQAANDLVEASRNQGGTVQRVLQKLQGISSIQNQMAREVGVIMYFSMCYSIQDKPLLEA